MNLEPRRSRGRPPSGGAMILKDDILKAVIKYEYCAQLMEYFLASTKYSRASIARVLSKLYEEYSIDISKNPRPYRYLREELKKRGLIS